MKAPLSRWNKGLNPDDYRITSNDLRILNLLDPWDGYDLLPTNAFSPFLPDLHPTYLRNRLRILWDAFGYLDRRTFTGKNNNAVFLYSLSETGISFLSLTKPYTRPGEWDQHALLGSLIMASIELGVRENPAQHLIKARSIIAHPRFNPDTPSRPFIFNLPKTRVTPDGKPFVIRRIADNASFLFIREDDRKTEQQNTTIRFKFEHYKHIWEHKLYERKYGIKRAFLIFDTVSEHRKRNLMETAARVFNGSCSYILFAAVPQYSNLFETVPITTALYDTPFERVGYPPFSLKTLEPIA